MLLRISNLKTTTKIPIGIGTPIAERPPTPPDIRITYPAIRLVKTDTNESE